MVIRHSRGGGSETWSLQNKKDDFNIYVNWHGTPLIRFNLNGKEFSLISNLEQLAELLRAFEFDYLELGSLPFNEDGSEIGFLENVCKLAMLKPQKTKLIVVNHDYYAICPSYNLLNYKGRYCEIPPIAECAKCLSKHRGLNLNSKPESISSWRGIFQNIFDLSNEVIFLSNNSRNLFLRVFNIEESKLRIVDPWEIRNNNKDIHNKDIVNRKKILFLGNINFAKGSEVVKTIVKEESKLSKFCSFYLLGNFENHIPEGVDYRGPYSMSQLTLKIAEISPDLIIIPSIWPETYCFTAEEAWRLGYEIAFFDIGALPERFSNRERCHVLQFPYSRNTANEILEILHKHE